MKREKVLRKIGDSVGIIFNKEEQSLFGLNVGDHVYIDMEKIKNGGYIK